jgi:hypothetical protein
MVHYASTFTRQAASAHRLGETKAESKARSSRHGTMPPLRSTAYTWTRTLPPSPPSGWCAADTRLPQMFEDDAEYERLHAQYPSFLTFKITDGRPDLKMKVLAIRSSTRHIRLAQELAAAHHGRQLATIQDDWKDYKPAEFRRWARVDFRDVKTEPSPIAVFHPVFPLCKVKTH